MKKLSTVIASIIAAASVSAIAAPIQMTESEMNQFVAGRQTMSVWTTESGDQMLRPSKKNGESTYETFVYDSDTGEVIETIVWTLDSNLGTCFAGRRSSCGGFLPRAEN
jgi:hypothetical protein